MIGCSMGLCLHAIWHCGGRALCHAERSANGNANGDIAVQSNLSTRTPHVTSKIRHCIQDVLQYMYSNDLPGQSLSLDDMLMRPR